MESVRPPPIMSPSKTWLISGNAGPPQSSTVMGVGETRIINCHSPLPSRPRLLPPACDSDPTLHGAFFLLVDGRLPVHTQAVGEPGVVLPSFTSVPDCPGLALFSRLPPRDSSVCSFTIPPISPSDNLCTSPSTYPGYRPSSRSSSPAPDCAGSSGLGPSAAAPTATTTRQGQTSPSLSLVVNARRRIGKATRLRSNPAHGAPEIF
jgi:hypothetical protein